MADVFVKEIQTWAPPPVGRVDVCVKESSENSWTCRRGPVVYSGTVSVEGSPVEAKVFILEMASMTVVQMIQSSSSGVWQSLGWSDAYPHVAICIDPTGIYQAITFDRL